MRMQFLAYNLYNSTGILLVMLNYFLTGDANVEVQYALPTKRSEAAVSELYSTVSKPKVIPFIGLYNYMQRV